MTKNHPYGENIDFLTKSLFLNCQTVAFYSAAALLAMQSTVLATAIPSVCSSVTRWYPINMYKIGSCDLHREVAKTL